MRGKLISTFGAVAVAAIGLAVLAAPAQAGDPYKIDAMLREKGAPAYLGNDFYSDSAQAPQNIEQVLPRSQTRKFEMRFQNDGELPDKIEIDEASFQKGGKWEFKAKIGQQNVTSLLKGPGFYLTPKLQPGKGVKVVLTITNRNGDQNCACLAWQIDGSSRKGADGITDSVRVLLDHQPF